MATAVYMSIQNRYIAASYIYNQLACFSFPLVLLFSEYYYNIGGIHALNSRAFTDDF